MSYSYGQSYGMAQYAVSGNPPTPTISDTNCIYLYLFTFTVAKISILLAIRNFFSAISSKRNALTCRSKRTGGKTLVSLLPPSVSGRNGFTLITSLFLFSLRPGTFYYLYVALHKSQTRYKVNEYGERTDEGNQHCHQQNPHNDTENFV